MRVVGNRLRGLPVRWTRKRIAWIAALVLAAAAVLLAFQSDTMARAWDAGTLMGRIATGRSEVAIERLPHPLVRGADGAFSPDLADAAPGALLYPGDLYLPPATQTLEGLENGAGLVLVPGASPGGKDDPRLIAFAETLAAAGFVVLVPDLPGLRAQQVSPSHARDIADAAAYLSARLDGRPVAVAAISYAVGPAVLAAIGQEQPRPIALVLGIGGYYDAVATTVFITTGWIRNKDGVWEQRMPNEFGKWAFIRANLPRISSPIDREILAEIARRKLHDAAATVDDLASRLGPEGRAVWQLLANRDRERVPALIGTLPPRVREALEGLNLAAFDLSHLPATLLLVHGSDDPILPPEGSAALAAAVPASELYRLASLTHVELTLESAGDAWTIWRACWSLIGWRDRLAAAD
jgi:pimeloyl-ACP methyl ester carboxylesterase